jgi:D-lactate dehydrogenase
MSTFKVAVFSAKKYDKTYFLKANAFNLDLTFFEAELNSQSLSLCEGFEAICLFVTDKLSENDIKELAKMGVRLIALRSAGFNHIDIKACHKQQITVSYVPDYSPQAVAEHTFALLLTLNRKTHKAYFRIKEQNFSLDGLMGFDLYQKTLGIVGLGHIGQAVAEIAIGFGMKVIAYDPNPDQVFIKARGINLLSFNDLLKQADVISLNCPLTVDNRHLIDTKAINLMKNGVVLLNTGRGGLVDTKALINGLKAKKFRCVGLDVYEQESHIFFEDHSEDVIDDDTLMRLTTFTNVLITSHQGFFTEEALTNIVCTTLKNIKSFIDGDPINTI